MSVVEVVDDLITLQALTEREADAASRKMLASLQRRVAERDRGAKVSEAAAILDLSAPTVRSWITAGVLPVTGTAPVRVDLLALADAKRAVDSLRRHADDAHLLADVLRLLRDRSVAARADLAQGIADASAGRVTRLDRARLDQLLPEPRPVRRRAPTKRAKPSTST